MSQVYMCTSCYSRFKTTLHRLFRFILFAGLCVKRSRISRSEGWSIWRRSCDVSGSSVRHSGFRDLPRLSVTENEPLFEEQVDIVSRCCFIVYRCYKYYQWLRIVLFLLIYCFFQDAFIYLLLRLKLIRT